MIEKEEKISDNISNIQASKSNESTSDDFEELLESLTPYVDGGVEVIDAKAVPIPEEEKKTKNKS